MYIKELTNEEFTNFTSTYNPSSLYQTKEYAFIMNKQKFNSILVGYIDNFNIVAASLIIIQKLHGFKYAYAPRGFLLDYNNTSLLESFTKDLKKYLGFKNIIAIKINPLIVKNVYDLKNNVTLKNTNYDTIFDNMKKNNYFHLGYNNYFEAFKPRFEAIIDMNIPYYSIFNNFKKEVRTKIRSAANKGVKIYKGDINNLDYLYLQAKNKAPHDLAYYKDCYNYFSNKNMIDFYYSKLNTEQYLKVTKLKYEEFDHKANEINHLIKEANNESKEYLLSKKMKLDLEFAHYREELIKATKLLSEYPDGVVTATILVVKHQDTISIIMDGHDPKFKAFNSKHLLLWKLIERYANLGYKKFNLGGMSSINITNNKFKGLNDFKLGFSPKIYEYVGDSELITNNALYFMYRNTAPIRSIIKK